MLFKKILKKSSFLLDIFDDSYYNNNVLFETEYGEVAQLARASGSYPAGHVFESHLRYQKRYTTKCNVF